MAFTRSTLQCILQRTGPLGVNMWVYDTTDATAVVSADGYFAGVGIGGANPLGMEVGDMVLVRIWPTAVPATTTAKNLAAPADAAWHIVIDVAADGDASLASETAIVVAAPPPPGPP